MNMLKAAAALIVAGSILSLAACGKPENKQAQEAPAAPVAVADTTIGPHGAGGISSAIPMTLDAVHAAAPLLVAAEIQDQADGQSFKAITLSLGHDEVFRVLPSADGAHVHAVVTRSTQARSAEGEVVGASLFRNAAPEGVVFCITDPDVIHEQGFSCSTDANGRFWRTYRLPDGYDGPTSPFDAIDPDLASEAMLVEMKWVAP